MSIFTQEAKIENLKFITKKNKVKDLIEFGRGFQNTPQLFILKKMVKSGDISLEAKINFSEDGSILKDYVIDGDLENVKLRLLNKDIIENIKFSFICYIIGCYTNYNPTDIHCYQRKFISSQS